MNRSNINLCSLIPILLTVPCLVASCATEEQEKGYYRQSVDPDGVAVVENGSIPHQWSGELSHLQLEEIAVIGQATGQEEYLLSYPYLPVAADAEGNIALIERRPMDIRVFDQSGRFIRHLGHEGEGPGEYTYLRGITYHMALGWVVTSILPGRILTFDIDGRLLETKSWQELLTIYGGTWDYWESPLFNAEGTHFWFLGFRSALRNPPGPGEDIDNFCLAWVRWSDLEPASVFEFTQPAQVMRDRLYPGAGGRYPYAPLSMAADSLGRLWLNHDFPYQIEIFEPGGEERWRVRIDYDLQEYPTDFRKHIESNPSVMVNNEFFYRELPPLQPAISALNWTGRNEMWVFTEVYVDSPFVRVDVLNSEGMYVRAFLADRAMRNLPIGRDYLFLPRYAEDGSPQIVRYRYWIE